MTTVDECFNKWSNNIINDQTTKWFSTEESRITVEGKYFNLLPEDNEEVNEMMMMCCILMNGDFDE